MDTIFALASARGKAGVSIIRLSGPNAHNAVSQFCKLPTPRYAALRKLVWKNDVIDQALVIVFEAGHSFTGEEAAELQLHGSVAVVAAVLRILSEFPELRLAEAGEFTRRALENGCLDLTQIEGLADLIESETEAQRKQAMHVFSGAIGKKIEGWRADLIKAASLIEATIDFADEDVPVDVVPEVRGLIAGLLQDLNTELAGTFVAERIRDGFEVAIVGPPNIGKSTLLNALVGREAAITSEIAGTTRDVIEVRLDLNGLAVTILDTAGLRETKDVIENIGIDRALQRATRADIRVFLVETADDVLLLQPNPEDIVVLGKGDQRQSIENAVSGITGSGIPRLIKQIGERLSCKAASASIFIRERHHIALVSAVKSLTDAKTGLESESARPELIAVDLRLAFHAMEVILGRIDVENLLDQIFLSFCIGK